MKQTQQLKLGPTQKQQQLLIVSPQMQKALTLLQLPVMELTLAVASELEENPVLEYSEEESRLDENETFLTLQEKNSSRAKKSDEDITSFVENTVAYEFSLFESLMQQAREVFSDSKRRHLALLIIGNLDENGFLGCSLEEIALVEEKSVDDLAATLFEIQKFDPPGVGARDVRESLLLQLERMGKKKSLAYTIIATCYEEMKLNRLPLIAKKIAHTTAEIQEAIENEIKHLVIHPVMNFSRGHYRESAQPIVPDVMITKNGKEFGIEVNEKSIPPFRINPHYLKMLTNESLPHETREYIEEKIASGKWLLRNLCERERTLYRITEAVLEKQQSFFESQEGNLHSLTMKEIAQELALHESTIARAVSGKYISSPRGLLPLRKLFTHAYETDDGDFLSAPAVKEMLQKIISEENPTTPLSDEALSKKMKERGIPCARRTVAKYRQELGIGSKSARKRY